jgi:NAD-dependent SIR2 family protein deacetylase
VDKNRSIEAAVELINNADAILIGAGAGMGVDSGLPDFRGKEGFWRAYPQLKSLNKSFVEMANGDLFYDNPELAWWFYGHRFNLYAKTKPHQGFGILQQMSLSKPTFAFTSNVDGHFQKAGFNSKQVIECHGSINHLQCANGCSDNIWKITRLPFKASDEDLSIEGYFPLCPNCGGIARPNILMFDDHWWVSDRTRKQESNFYRWLDDYCGKKITAIELGAGTAIPSVRNACSYNAKDLIRINLNECEVSKGQIPLKMPALDALATINELLM